MKDFLKLAIFRNNVLDCASKQFDVQKVFLYIYFLSHILLFNLN